LKSFSVENFLEESLLQGLTEFANKELDHSDMVKYAGNYGRSYSIVEIPADLKDSLVSKAREGFEIDDLDIVYAQVVRYEIKDGRVPRLEPHLDKLFCTHTLDIILDTNMEWSLIVEDVVFPSLKNSAVFLKGDEELHHRPEFPSESEGDYVLALFLHMAREGDKNLEMGRNFFKLPKEAQKLWISKMSPNQAF
jgi:hypothetical protein